MMLVKSEYNHIRTFKLPDITLCDIQLSLKILMKV